MKTSWQVATAGEAFAAAQFARCGWDVSIQYGANQPEYDLVAVDGDRVVKVSVKGSKDGQWGLTQSHLRKGTADYQGAIDTWLSRHTQLTIFCLVQFKGVPVTDLPRMYLATPAEIGAQLRATAKSRGDTILYERKVWTDKAQAAGTIDSIPESWRFTQDRLDQLSRLLSNPSKLG